MAVTYIYKALIVRYVSLVRHVRFTKWMLDFFVKL